MTKLSWNELFHFARAIEDNGEQFYRRAAERMEDPEVRAFFRRLAIEEAGHGQLFVTLQRKFGDDELDDLFPEEHQAYLRAYVDGMVFSEGKLEELVSKISSPLEAVRFAKQREQDTVHFYLEMRELLPAVDRDKVDELIAEERRHFLELARFEAKLDGSDSAD